ncbi:MAG: ATP-binding protein [Burkholderiales bacterium]|nr:ATP-binding protein [Burkholderiales bacterium]
MSSARPASYLVSLVHELRALPRETEWVEFKVNDAEPQAIGEYISALANAAALVGKAFAYVVWGVQNEDHAVVGTRFDPSKACVGNEALENWLLRLLEPKIDFRFFRAVVEDRQVVLRIPKWVRGHEATCRSGPLRAGCRRGMLDGNSADRWFRTLDDR